MGVWSNGSSGRLSKDEGVTYAGVDVTEAIGSV